MAQALSSHLNCSNSGYERSGPQCRSLVPIGPCKSPLSGYCKDGPREKGRSIAVLVCHNFTEAVQTC